MDGTPGLVHIAGMTESLMTLLLAVAVFVGSHFALTADGIRKALVHRLGEAGFSAVFSVIAVVALVWVVMAYRDARLDNVVFWSHSPALAMVPILVMPIALILIVCAVTTRNPTAAGGEKLAGDPRPQAGIVTVTRHPMLIGVTLACFAHMAPNGDAASLILFGGLAVLGLGGIVHIDQRRRRSMGAQWGPIALTTGVVPFMAALQGRTKIDWSGIGLWRVALGLGLYAALAYTHGWFTGVSILY
ncbi:MAG: NnrU family protein [Alphaproteobacteria bacterium]|nr:NnrU family protein [Alphaproteobacteria bacterium]